MARQTWTDLGNVSHVMDFIYDNNGKPYAFYYDGTLYYYITNLQGDVIRIIDTAGATICTYTYDAWGRLLNSSTNQIFKANPIRYRGYYYDTESGLYYLGSRYYDPAVKRFINADGAAFATINPYSNGLTDKNYFAYCDNDPVSKSDDNGAFWTIVIGAVTGGLINGVSTLIECQQSGESLKSTFMQTAISATSGAISGAIAGTGLGLAGQAIAGGLLGAGESFARQMVKTKSIKSVDVGAVVGAGLCGIAGGLMGGEGSLNGFKHATTQRKLAIDTIKRGRNFASIRKAAKNYATQTWRWAKNRRLGRETVLGIINSTISSKISGEVFK